MDNNDKEQDDLKRLHDILWSEEPNRIKGKWKIDNAKRDMFVKALNIVDDLCQKTGIFAYQSDDVNQPLYVHTIRVVWFSAEVELEGKAWAELLSNVDSLNMSKLIITDVLDSWQLSSEIYTELD